MWGKELPRRLLSVACLILLLICILTLSSRPERYAILANASSGTPQFWLLAVEAMRAYNVKDAQYLISALLEYPNWNNSTEHISHIRLLSEYPEEELDDQIKPCLSGVPSITNTENEIRNFLGQASPGDIVILYFHCHGNRRGIFMGGIPYSTLTDWLNSGGLRHACVTVVLEVCASGASIDDGAGGVLGPGRTVMAACLANESASGVAGEWHWFSHSVYEGFGLCQDSDNDGWISASEVFDYARPITVEISENIWDGTWAEHPVSYYGQVEGDVPLVQRDLSKPFPVWDVSVTSITANSLRVEPGSAVDFDVTVENQGEKSACLSVFIYFNLSLVAAQRMTLHSGEIIASTFRWIADGVYGLCTLKAVADICPGETNTINNYNEATVIVTYKEDLNADGFVGIDDLLSGAEAFGSDSNHPRWNPYADTNADGYVGIDDILQIAQHFGQEYC